MQKLQSIGNISKTLTAELKADNDFRESFDIVTQVANPDKRLFLVGGAVYRTLVRIIHGGKALPMRDYDFIVEEVPQMIEVVPSNWTLGKTSHGQHRLNHIADHNRQIDIVRLADAINTWDSSPFDLSDSEACLDSYLDKVPLTIQCIAYDIRTQELYGHIGYEAILTRTVAIHHYRECLAYCLGKGTTPIEYAHKKANSLGLDVIGQATDGNNTSPSQS